MTDDPQQSRSPEDGACTYCGSQLAATSPICFACGMPRFQPERASGLRTPTPSPQLTAMRKAYVPDAQHYTAIPAEPTATIPPPKFDEISAGGGSEALANAVRDIWSRGIRPAVTVLLIAALSFAVVLGVGKAWQARAVFHFDLKQMRTKAREIGRAYVSQTQESVLPHYTATPRARSVMVRRTADSQPAPPKQADSMSVQTIPTSPAPSGCGPGILQVRIAPTPGTNSAVPASVQNLNTPPLASERSQ